MNISHLKIVGIAILGSMAIAMSPTSLTAEQILKKAEQKLKALTRLKLKDEKKIQQKEFKFQR